MRRLLCTLLFLLFAVASAEAKIYTTLSIGWHNDIRPERPPLVLDVYIVGWATMTPPPTGTIELRRFGRPYAAFPAMGVHTVEVAECGYSMFSAVYSGDANYESSSNSLWAGAPCPTPTITAITPDHIYPDQSDVIVTISGSNFAASPLTTAQLTTPYKSSWLQTWYVSWSQVQAKVPLALFGPNPRLPNAGILSLSNSGSQSNQVPFDLLPRSTTIRYDNAGHMTAEITPGGQAIWLRGGRYVDGLNRSPDALLAVDGDADGIVSYDCGVFQPYSTWILAELGNAAWQARYPYSVNVGTTLPPAGLIQRGVDGLPSRLVIRDWGGEHLLWLRAGVGAWDLVTVDNDSGDQWPLDDQIEVAADRFRSMTGAAPPRMFERGDFLAVVNGEGQYFATILDEAMVTPTPGNGWIDATGGVATEGNPVIVTFLRKGGRDGTLTVHYATRDRTAIAGVNYTASSGSVSFGPGEIVKSIAVPTVNYPMYGGSSPLLFDLDVSVEGGPLETAMPLKCTIAEADPRPKITFSPTCVQEGDGPYTIPLKFKTNAARMPINVTWKGRCFDCCNADCRSDHYFCAYDCFGSGSFVLAPGETEHEVIINLIGDTWFGGDRLVQVDITSDVAQVGWGLETELMIADNDPPRIWGTASPSVEGNSGKSDITVRLTAQEGRYQPVGPAPCRLPLAQADYQTEDGTAKAGTDYVAARGTATVGTPFTISINGDRFLEPDETFSVRFSNVRNGVLGNPNITATIVNDDAATTVPITVGSSTVMEGASSSDMAMLPVTLDTPAAYAYDVPWITRDGTAVAGSDYTASAGTLTFAEGEKEKLIAVPVLADSIPEIDETFDVIADNRATGRVTIKDTDGLPALFVNDVTVVEGAGGRQSAATFEVKLSRPSGACVTVEYATADATAVAPRDYAVTHGLLTFEPGEISKSVTVPIAGDNDAEPAEQFYLTLNWPNNATMGRPLGLCTIVNDDGRRRSSGR